MGQVRFRGSVGPRGLGGMEPPPLGMGTPAAVGGVFCFLFCTTWLVTSLDKSSFLFPFVSTIYPYYAAFQLSYLIRFRILGYLNGVNCS